MLWSQASSKDLASLQCLTVCRTLVLALIAQHPDDKEMSSLFLSVYRWRNPGWVETDVMPDPHHCCSKSSALQALSQTCPLALYMPTPKLTQSSRNAFYKHWMLIPFPRGLFSSADGCVPSSSSSTEPSTIFMKWGNPHSCISGGKRSIFSLQGTSKFSLFSFFKSV